jgi:hypothetical protein
LTSPFIKTKDLVTVEELGEETRKLYPGREESFYDGSGGFPVYVGYSIFCKKFKSLSSLKLSISALEYHVSLLEYDVKTLREYLRKKEFDIDSLIDKGEKVDAVRYLSAEDKEMFKNDKDRLRNNAEILFTEIDLFVYELYSTHIKEQQDDELIPGFIRKLKDDSPIRKNLIKLTLDFEEQLDKYLIRIYFRLYDILDFNNKTKEQLDLAIKHIAENPILEIDWTDRNQTPYMDCSFLREDMDNLREFEKYDKFKLGYILNVHHKFVPETSPTHAVCVIKLYTPTSGGVQKYVFIDSNLRTLVTFDTQQEFKDYLVKEYQIVYHRFISITSYGNPGKILSSSQTKYPKLLANVNAIMSEFLKEKEEKVDESEMYG